MPSADFDPASPKATTQLLEPTLPLFETPSGQTTKGAKPANLAPTVPARRIVHTTPAKAMSWNTAKEKLRKGAAAAAAAPTAAPPGLLPRTSGDEDAHASAQPAASSKDTVDSPKKVVIDGVTREAELSNDRPRPSALSVAIDAKEEESSDPGSPKPQRDSFLRLSSTSRMSNRSMGGSRLSWADENPDDGDGPDFVDFENFDAMALGANADTSAEGR